MRATTRVSQARPSTSSKSRRHQRNRWRTSQHRSSTWSSVAPANAVETFQSGQQSTIQVSINEVDPVAAGYAGFIASVLNQKINEEIIKQAVSQGQVQQATQIPPSVVAAPTTVSLSNVAASTPVDRRVCRAGGARPDAPAYGRHAHRPVVHPRAVVRSDGAVPRLADQLIRARPWQIPWPGHRQRRGRGDIGRCCS